MFRSRLRSSNEAATSYCCNGVPPASPPHRPAARSTETALRCWKRWPAPSLRPRPRARRYQYAEVCLLFSPADLVPNRGRWLRIAVQSIDNGEVAYRAACGAAPELITPIADRKYSLAELENPPGEEEVSHPAANRFRSRGATSSAVGNYCSESIGLAGLNFAEEKAARLPCYRRSRSWRKSARGSPTPRCT